MSDPNVITYSEACQLIENLIVAAAVDEPLRKILLESSWGATIPINTFIDEDKANLTDELTYNGMQMWFCYNRRVGPDKLFLCFQKRYDLHMPNELNDTSKIPQLLPGPDAESIFKYANSDGETIDVLLKKHNPQPMNGRTWPDGDILKMTDDFLNKFPDGSPNPYCIYKSGFFNNDTAPSNYELKQFLKDQKDKDGRDVTHVRYYFGWNPDARHSECKLRVIVFSVNTDDGTNVITRGAGVAEAKMLQKSWPPR